MRSLSKRLDALEVASLPFEPRTCHLIGRHAGQTEADAIAAHSEAVGPDDMVIFLCGIEPRHA